MQTLRNIPTILEVALNGPWGRERQPGIPIAVDEIVREGIACVRAGAAVVHVHPYDAVSGRQRDELDLYVAIIEGIRSQVDAVVYPTAPFVDDDGQDRYAVTEELARRGLIEWATMDTGSLNVVRFDELGTGGTGFVYRNPVQAVRGALQVAQRHRLRASFACYEPGFVRLGAALHAQHPGAATPVYRLMLSDEFTFGFPPTTSALDAYASLLAETAPSAPVMVAGLGVSVLALVPDVIKRGWHLRVGLEDAPFGTRATNEQLVRGAAQAIVEAGGQLASPAAARLLP